MEIKKADSKGRVSGFTPGVHYAVKQGPYASTVLRPVLGGDWFPDEVPQEALEYMMSFGLDPLRVMRDRATPEGYDEAQLDPDGKRLMEHGAVKVERKPWPEGFDWGVLTRFAAG